MSTEGGPVTAPDRAGTPGSSGTTETAGQAHNQHNCPECQAMIKNGGHRIIDLMGHAGYATYRASIGRGFALKWTDTREAWAQVAVVLGAMWAPYDSFDDWMVSQGHDPEAIYTEYGNSDMLAAFQAGADTAAQAAIAAAAPAPAGEGVLLSAKQERQPSREVNLITDDESIFEPECACTVCAEARAEQPQAAPGADAAMAALAIAASALEDIKLAYAPGYPAHDIAHKTLDRIAGQP